MTLEDLLHLTRRRIGSLALVIVACVLASMVFAFASPSSYTATAQAYLHVKVAGDPAENALSHYSAEQLASMKADAMVPVFTSAAVARRVVDSLKLDVTPEELASSVSAARTPETVSVQVSASASSSHQAQVVADEVVRQAGVEVKEVEGDESPVEIVLLSSAELVSATRSPALATCVAVGLLAGLVLGYARILIQELLDKSLKEPEEVREALSVPLLGALPRVPSLRWLSRGAEIKMEEQLRAARTNVLHALSQGDRRVLVVTSAGPQERTSVTAASLARVLALSGHRVALVEGDLRSPSAVGLQERPGGGDGAGGERRVRADRTTTYLCELCTIERECELLGDGGPVNLPPRVAQILNVINSSNVRIFSDILCLNDKQLLALIVVVAEGVTHNVICQEIASSYTSRRSHPTSRTYENLASTLQMC